MRILITAGPTREPIDPVRYISNRSSGTVGRFLAEAAIRDGHGVTMILGPVTAVMPESAHRVNIETSRQMLEAVLAEFPKNDLLIMAAAVADYRPKHISQGKIERRENMLLELEATEDVIAAAGKIKRADQRTVGFSLVDRSDQSRSIAKLVRKNLDLIVSNPLETMDSGGIAAVLLWPGGRTEELPYRTKAEFADNLLDRALALFDATPAIRPPVV